MLLQHIYTSAGRMDFGTVAISPGIGADIRRILEARAKSFPDERLWVGDSPPFVVRGFPIPAPNQAFGCAVSKLLAAGASYDGRDGNYLAHTHLVPEAFLAAQNYNLPWIAACLPLRHDFHPISGYGIDPLEPWDGEIDPAGQLRMFAFAAREMTPAGLRALVERLVEHACAAGGDAPFDLDMPPPHPDLPAIFEEAYGAGAPEADEIRLLRLVAALAVLPPAFKRDRAFTVNDLGSRAPGLRVLRGWRESPPAAVHGWPWFDHCAALAASGRQEALWAMTTWLSRLLPVECRPSPTALDCGFTFYAQVVAPEQHTDDRASLAAAAQMIAAFSRCEIDVSVLHEAVRPLLEYPAGAVADRFEVYAALARVAAAARRPLPVPLADAIIGCLQDPVAGRGPASQAFLTGLPREAQGALWSRAFACGLPPARVPRTGGVPDRSQLEFAVATFDPTLVRDHGVRQGVIEHLVGHLVQTGEAAPALVADRRLRPTVCGLWALTRMERCHGDLLPALSDRLARSLIDASFPDDWLALSCRRSALSSLVRGLLHDSGALGPAALAEFARAVARDDAPAARAVVFDLELGAGYRERTIEFAAQLDRAWNDAEAGRVVGVLCELADLLNHPDALTCAGLSRDPLGSFSAWRKSWSPDRSLASEELRAQFWQRLEVTLRHAPAISSFPVAVSYLRVTPGERHGIFRLAMNALTRDLPAVARWLGSESANAWPGRAGFLAWFLVAADERGARVLEDATSAVDQVLVAMPWEETRHRVTANLGMVLDAEPIAGRVKKKYRASARQW